MTTIKLNYAIAVDGIETKSLTLRRPKVKDMLSVDKVSDRSADQEVHLLANLCEIPMTSLIELDMKDYGQLQKAYQGFL